jgi:hypothetical protein
MAPHIAPTTPLLDNAEQNIGNVTTLYPQSGLPTVIPQSNPPRILNLNGSSKRGQSTTVAFAVSRILQGEQNPNPGLAGPVTAILEFGNGAQFSQVEFDLQVGPFAGPINNSSAAVQPRDGLVLASVPAGALRAYARYDNLLLEPLLGLNPPASLAAYLGVPVVGPGGPVLCQGASGPVPPEPVLVKAIATYFNKTHSRVWRTLNLYITPEINSPAPTAVQVGNPSPTVVSGYSGYCFWALPAFTRSVKILRFPDTTALAVLIHDGVRPVDFVNIAANVTAPEIEIVGNENIVGITSGNDKVTMLKVVCEIGI